MNKRIFIFFAAYSASALLGIAQDKPDKPLIDPPELVNMREEHLRNMQRVVIPALIAYERQLRSQKDFFSRQGKLDAALAVENEIKEITRQLEVANAAATNKAKGSMQLAIVSATYGHTQSKRVVDTTKILRKALESGTPTLVLNSDQGAGGTDPAPYAPKDFVIAYTINGQRKEKKFPENRTLNFKEDLK